MSANSGTNIAAPIRPFDSSDTFPVAYADELLGGLHSVDTLLEMYSIPYARRKVGMLCSVKETDAIYKLINNRKFINTNKNDWTPIEGAVDLSINGCASEKTTTIDIDEGLVDGCIMVNNKQVKFHGADKLFSGSIGGKSDILEATEQDIDDMFKGQL